jgi:glutaredoxin-like YruB-family protein
MEAMIMQVKVFSTKTCPWCVKAKDYLKSLNVSYEDVDVSANREAAMEMVRATKQMGVPVIQIGEKYIVGFDQGAIEKSLREAGII